MKKWILAALILLLAACLCLTATAEERTLVSDAEWAPPDLSAVTTDSPELLILKVAQEEVGYVEEKAGKSARSKYGEWMGHPYAQWCAEFITWCVNQVDERYGTSLLRNTYPYYGTSSDGAPFFIKLGRFVSSNGKLPTGAKSRQWWAETGEYLKVNEYIPYPGDYMWLYIPGFNKNRVSHVALVEGVSLSESGEVTIHVIEGNMPDRVQRATYAISDYRIYGFGTPVKRVETEMRISTHRSDVITAKQWLKQLGFYTAKDMTDNFTKTLQKAVKKYQRSVGISASGIINMKTWQALQASVQAAEADSQTATATDE